MAYLNMDHHVFPHQRRETTAFHSFMSSNLRNFRKAERRGEINNSSNKKRGVLDFQDVNRSRLEKQAHSQAHGNMRESDRNMHREAQRILRALAE